jgi:hypothetical protein
MVTNVNMNVTSIFEPATRACPGHPRLSTADTKDVDGRNKSGHDDGDNIDGSRLLAQCSAADVAPTWLAPTKEGGLSFCETHQATSWTNDGFRFALAVSNKPQTLYPKLLRSDHFARNSP